jgi:hypothetical protein
MRMIPFPTADAVWPQGAVRWRMCILPNPARDHGLQQLLDHARKATAPFPLAEVADADLDIGICPLERPGVPGRQQLREVAAVLAEHLADLPLFALTAARVHVGVGSVLFELGPHRLWSELTGRIAAGVGVVLGPQAVGPPQTRPHLTIAYGAGHCASIEIAAALEAALAREYAEVLIDAVHLVQVRQNAPAHGYRLTPTLTVQLGRLGPLPDMGKLPPAAHTRRGDA